MKREAPQGHNHAWEANGCESPEELIEIVEYLSEICGELFGPDRGWKDLADTLDSVANRAQCASDRADMALEAAGDNEGSIEELKGDLESEIKHISEQLESLNDRISHLERIAGARE
ncbi:hypothetical protein AUQ37_03965 [Candidatus Methanomethylophilus sp. 1R26]|uniref:hypothetical protein n=1 Tax=Candidatus Methanomethylophilus sp. 1R26 TaxID=1769296 RepID=UPI0007370019|nr:hypothetical protein [Candidatus Methanomethylophilus sp. 1R26]KUE73026.1 hypothetical protein AUQ37_03965 [Candidatus Methanomethylophilus sp. 1R26]